MVLAAKLKSIEDPSSVQQVGVYSKVKDGSSR